MDIDFFILSGKKFIAIVFVDYFAIQVFHTFFTIFRMTSDIPISHFHMMNFNTMSLFHLGFDTLCFSQFFSDIRISCHFNDNLSVFSSIIHQFFPHFYHDIDISSSLLPVVCFFSTML